MNIKKETKFKVKSLGLVSKPVYDIEVEDNHNFFANNICVHNSNYYNVEPLINDYSLDDIDKNILEPIIKKTIYDIIDSVNGYHGYLDMVLDSQSNKGIFHKKKKYILYNSTGIKISGFQSKSAIYSKTIRNWLSKLTDLIISGKFYQFIESYNKIKAEFYKSNYEELAEIITINLDISNRKIVRGALFYNRENPNNKIVTKNRVQYAYLIKNEEYDLDIIAWPSSHNSNSYIDEHFKHYIDYDRLFERTIVKNIQLICDYCIIDINQLINDDSINQDKLLHILNLHFGCNYKSLNNYKNSNYNTFIPKSSYIVPLSVLLDL
jgi:hypothetical protein